MTQDELERLYAAGDSAAVQAALRQRAQKAGEYWAVRSPEDAAVREFGSSPDLENLSAAAELGVAGLKGTFLYEGYRQVRDSIGMPLADPNWNPAHRWDEISQGVSSEYHGELIETDSEEDYLRLKGRITEDQQNMRRFSANGPAGMAAMIGGSLFDVDLLLAPLTDGAYTAAKIARTVKSARAARMLGTAIETGTVSGVFDAGRQYMSPADLDWTGVASATLAGLVMGGAAGTFISPPTRRLWTDGAQKMRDEFHSRMASDVNLGEFSESIPSTSNYTQYVAQATKRKQAAESAGAAATTPGFVRGASSPELVNERQRAWVDLAGDELAQKYGPKGRAPNRDIEKALQAIEDAVNVGGFIGSDWHKLATSKTNIGRWIADRFLESPTGRGGRVQTAALDREMYLRRILQGMPEYNASYARWAKGQNASMLDMHWKPELAEQFGKEFHLEMNYRRLNDTENPSAHPEIKKAADAIERQAKEAYDLMKAAGVDGFDTIQYKRGYTPLRWLGRNFIRSIQANIPEKKLIELVVNGYRPTINLPEDELRVFARAVVSRAMTKAEDFDTSLQFLLSGDGRTFLRQRLIDNGISQKRADEVIDGLTGPMEERGKASFAKGRMEIDLSAEYDGLRLIDYVDNNISNVWTLYARQASGNAALARAGIKSKAQRSEMIDALLAEQLSIGETPMAREFIEGVFSYFDAGPVNGGVSPIVSRIKKLTNLAILNKMGIAQTAEFGAIIAATGVENFIAHSPVFNRLLKNARVGNTDSLLDELAPWTGRIWDEEKLINPEFDFNSDRLTTQDSHEFLHGLDKFLAKGQRLQGHASLFYTTRRAQTRIAAAGITDKLFKMLKDGTVEQAGRRFNDIGFVPEMRDQLDALIRDGTIEFLPSGHIDRLNMDRWSPQLAHEFSGAITRFVHQVIQKDLIGEGSQWMSGDMGALLTHLRQFPLLAIQKQILRNARIMDTTTAATLLYGLMTASVAYTAGQLIEGRTDRLDPISIGKGAMNYSNMTGFLPMLGEPLGAMTGIDDFKMLSYSQYGRGTFGMPALDWINKAIRAPGALASAVDGSIEKSDKSALKALPFANMYGSAMLFNALEE